MTPLANHPDVSLLPEGAVFLSVSSTLVAADIHLGKSAAFRAKGLPVPEGDTARDLSRLVDLSHKYGAARLVIAGDFFHAPSGMTPELEAAIEGFLKTLGIPVLLVLGNHDVKIPRFPAGLEVLPNLDLENDIRVIHDPDHAESGRLCLSGHWHPVVRIPDGKRTSLRLPCFLLRGRTLVMPAFGSFTGGAILSAKPEDRVFVTLRDEVIELPAAMIS